MQMKHWPVGRTGGEEDPVSSGEGAQSSAGDNRSMRDGGGSNSWSISLHNMVLGRRCQDGRGYFHPVKGVFRE